MMDDKIIFNFLKRCPQMTQIFTDETSMNTEFEIFYLCPSA